MNPQDKTPDVLERKRRNETNTRRVREREAMIRARERVARRIRTTAERKRRSWRKIISTIARQSRSTKGGSDNKPTYINHANALRRERPEERVGRFRTVRCENIEAHPRNRNGKLPLPFRPLFSQALFFMGR